MTLNEYLHEACISPEKFAEKLGTTGQAVRYWLNGERHPKKVNIQEIQIATGGKVKPEDWF